jgi:hypothetical protein
MHIAFDWQWCVAVAHAMGSLLSASSRDRESESDSSRWPTRADGNSARISNTLEKARSPRIRSAHPLKDEENSLRYSFVGDDTKVMLIFSGVSNNFFRLVNLSLDYCHEFLHVYCR